MDDKFLVLTDDKVFVTVQGEGKFQGYPSIFVRLSICNLRCKWTSKDGTETKCDTPYSSFVPERNRVSVKHLYKEIVSHFKVEHVVITGGEPGLQDLSSLVEGLSQQGKLITIETNGTKSFENLLHYSSSVFLSISPKLKNSGHEYDEEEYASQIASLCLSFREHQLKFVVGSVEEAKDAILFLAKVQQICDRGPRPRESVKNKYLMPMGITKEQITEAAEWLIPYCIQSEINYCDRLHIRQWGHKRAV